MTCLAKTSKSNEDAMKISKSTEHAVQYRAARQREYLSSSVLSSEDASLCDEVCSGVHLLVYMPTFVFCLATIFTCDLDAGKMFYQTCKWVPLPLQLCCPIDHCFDLQMLYRYAVTDNRAKASLFHVHAIQRVDREQAMHKHVADACELGLSTETYLQDLVYYVLEQAVN